MDNKRIIEILETLLDGYSPTTGECLEDNIILNDREIIRALTIVVLKLKEITPDEKEEINEIDANDFFEAIKVFDSYGINVTENRLRKFFSGRELSENEDLKTHDLFGKYEDTLTGRAIFNSVKGFFNEINKRKTQKKEWSYIKYFNKEKFNYLTQNEIDHYFNLIDKIELVKKDDLKSDVINARKKFNRAYEPWLEIENQILKEVIKKTNNLEILSYIFKRGSGGISSQAKKLIHFNNENNTYNDED